MPGVNLIVGDDGSNSLQGGAGKDLMYGFDPNGPQGQVSSIAATRMATGLNAPLFAAAPPGDLERLFIVEQGGEIKVLNLATGQVTLFLDVPVDNAGERGLLGLAFDPDYATNGFFYIYRTVPGPGAHNQIDRYHVSGNPNIADAASATPIISLGNLSTATNHNAGWIGFGPDGYLYAATGENANAANAQDANNLLGKIIRIDVDQDAFPDDPAKNYGIPADNMFAATAGADEIFALGLRNPYRDSFDRATGDFFIADVGQSSWEEINIGQGGANYGWPIFEGLSTDPNFISPIHAYDHSVGMAVIGGYVYRGQSEGLHGQYFFADLNGEVFTLRRDGNVWVRTEPERTSQIQTDVGSIDTPTSFGEDAFGNLYIVDIDGDVFKLTPLVASADQNDTLRGFAGDDMMFGGSGDDLLDGGFGTDILNGGIGNDRYFIDDSRDQVVEEMGSGNDRAFADTSYVLPAGLSVETLSTTSDIGTAEINLTGNEIANVLIGNDGANVLNGRGAADVMAGYGGNDWYFVDAAGDKVVWEGANDGNDRVFAGVSYALAAGQSIETLSTTSDIGIAAINLIGNEIANVLIGNDGANVLNGRGAADVMAGYGGNDRYFADNAGDKVVFEGASDGIDRVFAGVSYTLAATQRIETLSTTNNARIGAINLTGNEFANTLIANAGANVLNGGAGADVLASYGGNDIFLFNTAIGPSNIDTLYDFVVANDTVHLENAIFTQLTTPAGNTLSGAQFFTGAAAHDADDRIIYNSGTGALFYDSDGDGAAAAIQFAKAGTGLGLTNADFFVV